MIAFLLAGCSLHSAPENNLDFEQILQLSELEGVYSNKGNPSGFLSQKIWPDIKEVFPEIRNVETFDTGHDKIELIEVLAGENSLTVKAIRNGCAIYEKSYIPGRDFTISHGKLVIHRESHLLSRGSDDVLLGPSYEEVTIGIDTGKQGKSRSKGYAAGLVFMVIPVAVSDMTDIRYERVYDKPRNYGTCHRH